MKHIGSDEARRTFRDLLDEAQLGESAEISRNGKRIAVLVPAAWYSTAVAIGKGVHAFTHDTDGNLLAAESQLPVGELRSAIGDAAIKELESGDDPRGTWVYHKDGDPLNNDPGNLELRERPLCITLTRRRDAGAGRCTHPARRST